jgi:hypothetical protein
MSIQRDDLSTSCVQHPRQPGGFLYPFYGYGSGHLCRRKDIVRRQQAGIRTGNFCRSSLLALREQLSYERVKLGEPVFFRRV